MRNLIFILLAFFAVFTFIRAYDNAEAQIVPTENQQEIPVEIIR